MFNCCPIPRPGYLAEPYPLPGYAGHLPTMRDRFGGSIGRLGHDILEDPCVAQAPKPVLRPPVCPCPPIHSDPPKRKTCPIPLPPCLPYCDPRAHHLNRGPYCCPCRPEPDTEVYRCCEHLPSSYTGHIPGYTFHSTGRTSGLATWGVKQYMNMCMMNDVPTAY